MIENLKHRFIRKSRSYSRKGVLDYVKYELIKTPYNSRILSIGSGGEIGRLVQQIATEKKSFLIEIDNDLERSPNICCNASYLSIKDSSFNIILLFEVLPHIANISNLIRELERVLSKNGIILVSSRFLFPINDAPIDYYRFTNYGLIKLLSNFNILNISPHLNLIQTIGVIVMRICYVERMTPFFLMLLYLHLI